MRNILPMLDGWLDDVAGRRGTQWNRQIALIIDKHRHFVLSAGQRHARLFAGNIQWNTSGTLEPSFDGFRRNGQIMWLTRGRHAFRQNRKSACRIATKSFQ